MSQRSVPLSRLKSAAFLEGLDDRLLTRLAGDAVVRELGNGDSVWRVGETATHFILVEAGLVAIRQLSLEGESSLVSLFGPGESLCITPALEGMRFPSEAVAITDAVTVIELPAAPVIAAMATDTEVHRTVNRVLLEHTRLLRGKIDIISAGSVPRRLAALMLHLVDRFGTVTSGNHANVAVVLTREQLAQLVNARTETVIRILSKWQKAGWFKSTSKGFQIERMEILERIVQGRPAAGARGG